MRYFVVLGLVVIGIFYLRQTKTETTTAANTSTSSPQLASAQTPTTQPHWPAASINRAHTVAQEVKRERVSNSEP